MNLFVLTKIRGKEIAKLPLVASVQTELARHFRSAVDSFWAKYEEAVVFDGRYKPDDDETLEISNFEEGNELISAIQNPATIDDFIVNNSSLFQIKALFAGHTDKAGNLHVVIQKFDKKKIITTSGISLFWSESHFKRVDGQGISIDGNITALLFEGQRLRFRNFFVLKQIFDMSKYYAEATDHEIKTFGSIPSIHISHIDVFIRNAKPWIRRKVYMIQESKILEKNSVSKLKSIADKMNIPLQVKSGKIDMPTSKTELKRILQFLDQDIYLSPFSDELWIANSKKKG